MQAQNTEFQDRLARIIAGQGKTTVFVGQELAFSYVPRHRRQANGLSDTMRNAGYALSFPACLAAGFFSHALGLYIRWIVEGVPKPAENPDVEMAVIALVGSVIAILLTHLLGLRERALIVPKFLGVACGMLFFHNLVHTWPELFDRIFSPIWVAKITTMTEAHSLVFRGISIPF